MEGFGVFVIWLGAAIGIGALASSRGRSGFGFFLLSVLLSPVVGLVVVLVIKDLVAERTKEDLRRKEDERTEKQRQKEHEKQLESIKALAATRSVPASDGARPSAVDELEKLASLRERGLLTNEEFTAQKAKIIGS